jgi:hypothetical protein
MGLGLGLIYRFCRCLQYQQNPMITVFRVVAAATVHRANSTANRHKSPGNRDPSHTRRPMGEINRATMQVVGAVVRITHTKLEIYT